MNSTRACLYDINKMWIAVGRKYEAILRLFIYRFTFFQYWESLREKLEKLEVSDKCLETDMGEELSHELQESRERSVTGSSDTPSSNGERFVSGQSSSQESKSDGGSFLDGMAQSLDSSTPEGSLASTYTPSDFGKENTQDKLAKGRRTPPGSCAQVIENELESSKGTLTELSSIVALEDGHPVKVSNPMEMPPQHIKNCTVQPVSTDASEINMTLGNETVTDELRIIELDEDVKGVYEGNMYDGIAKEEADGSSSPPPTPCQPSRNLTVIVEELEHCALPE